MRTLGRGSSGKASALLLMLFFFLAGLAGSAWFFYARRNDSSPTATAQNPPSESREGGEASEDSGAAPPSDSGDPLTVDQASQSLTEGRRNAVVMAAERAAPSVVTVGVTQTAYVQGPPRVTMDPFDSFFFRRYLPGALYEQEIPSLGSGFIVDEQGVILTNEHVVRDAHKIEVILSDGRRLPARLVGKDSAYDLAVLKIEADRLKAAELGDSDKLLVGEWAIAIGNPFGFYLNDYQPTVTVGVISAIHRDVKGDSGTEAVYKDMIQTDAAINPGNSGGPLLNSMGQVIGINTFIFTQGGGSLGIGFAMPINTAVRVAKDIMRYGRSRPIWLGVEARELSPWLAERLGLRDPRGIVVTEVEQGSPADRAGIKAWDIVRGVNGAPISTVQAANRTIFGSQVGDLVRFTIERQGKILEIEVRVEAAPEVPS